MHKITLRKQARDLTALRRGRLVVLYPVEDGVKRASGSIMWLCDCDCGQQAIVSSNNLLRGSTFSCGCQKSENVRMRRNSVTHDMCYSPEWVAWSAMKTRCTREAGPQYEDWGGRGIEVCAEWQDDFEAFFAYIGPRPSLLHSVDRYPDNDGNYEPGNVRWATREQQMGNKRDNIVVTAFSETKRLLQFIPWGGKSPIYERAARRIRRGADPEITIVAALLGR